MTLLSTVSLLTGPADLTPDEARGRLRRELTGPEYVERNLLARLVEWLERLVNDLFATAAGVPLASWIAGMTVGLVLLGALVLVLSRFRRSARTATPGPRTPVLRTRVGADELRRRAHAARERGDHGEAVVEAYRALAVRQVERRRILDQPGATAHEVGELLAEIFPSDATHVRTAAALFDRALYSDRPLTAGDSEFVLTLDTALDTHDRSRRTVR